MSTQNNINKIDEGGSILNTPVENIEQKADSGEVSSLKENVGGAAVMETVDVGEESAEMMGRVSEVMSENASENQGDSKGGAKKDDGVVIDPEELRKRLLQAMPARMEMRRQIEKEIRKEIDYLHKKAMKMLRSSGEVNYFEMNNIVKKIRELKGILLILVKASMESMKTLWLRFVHGVM